MEKEKKIEKDSTKFWFILYVAAALFTVALLGYSILAEEKDTVPAPFMDAWYSDPEMTRTVNLKKPEFKDFQTVFYASVPDGIALGDDLWFKAKNGFLTVSVGGQVRVRRELEEYTLYGRTAGTDWICVPLEQADAGKLIQIHFTTNYDDKSAYIDEVYIGRALDNIRFTLSDRIFGTVLCVLMIFFALVLIGVHIVFSVRIKQMSNELLYLGASAFFISLWSLTELRVLQLFTEKNAGMFHNLTCMSMMLIATPLILYFKQDLDRVNRYIALALVILSCMNFIICSILHFAGLFDYHQTLTITHLTIVICAIWILFANFMRIFRSGDQKHGNIPVAVCMMIVLLAGILDLLRYRSGGIKDAALFTRIGLFIYITVLGVRSLLNVVSLAEKGLKSDIIARLAYEDGLTGLGNRTAYNERLEELSGKAVSVFIFDINNLKYVNDHFGHAEGDELIKTGAELIDAVFGDVGKCYRVGGDEFVCLTEGTVDAGRYETEFYRRMRMINNLELLRFPLVIASGCASCEAGADLKTAVEDADQKMYLKKKELKQEEGGKYDRVSG